MATAFPTAIKMQAGVVERGATTYIKTVQAALGIKRTTARIDSHTRGKLRVYQAKNKLPITGRVDSATWVKLGV